MKLNTRKLLLLLYQLEEDRVEYEHLLYLWPELSSGGRRALVFHLQQKQYIMVRKYNGKSYLRITSYGEMAIKNQIPALQDQSGSLHCIVLMTSPPFDSGFLKLRRVLKEQGAALLTPSTYLYMGKDTDKVIYLCREKYFTSVAVFMCGEWKVGNKQVLLQEKTDAQDSLNLLSGISREIHQLIDKKITFSDSNHQSNLVLFSAFDRLLTVLENASVFFFSSLYSPTSGRDLLKLFQSLV